MKTETLLKSMVSDLWRDLQEPTIFWQLAVLLACGRLLELRLSVSD